MRNSKKVTTVVLVGAVGLASAAYGIGSQMGDGSASAGSGAGSSSASSAADRGFDRGAPPGFGNLADELGVDADALEAALREFHDQEASGRRTDFTDALASALGISADKVSSALDQLGEQKRERFAKRLANELGVDAAKVQTALDELADERPDRGAHAGPGGPGDLRRGPRREARRRRRQGRGRAVRTAARPRACGTAITPGSRCGSSRPRWE